MSMPSQNSKKLIAFVSADAKCKVSIGELGFPLAAVSQGKKVLVGANETAMVAEMTLARFQSFQMLYLSKTYQNQITVNIKLA